MIYISPEEISILEKIYIVANTPSYLYKHFKREVCVERLASNYNVKELIKHIAQIDRKKERLLADVTSAYAACVAMTFHDVRTVTGLMRQLKFRNIEWVKEIINIWESSYIPTQITDMCYTHEPKIQVEKKSHSDVSTERKDISYQHEPKVGEKDLFQSDSSLTNIIHGEEKDD